MRPHRVARYSRGMATGLRWLLLPLTYATAHAAEFVPNEPFELGSVERDLTGDGAPELLRLTAVGPAIDALDIVLTIESAGEVVYEYRLTPLARTVGFDAGQHELSAEAHEARVREFAPEFFVPQRFRSAADFVAEWRTAPRLLAALPVVIERDRPAGEVRDGETIWREIQASPVTIFSFSPGGDRVEAIAWSARARRFYRC